MKAISRFVTFLIILAVFLSCSTPKKDTAKADPLVGLWQGIDGTGKMGSFLFYKDGYVLLIIGGKTIGGRDYKGRGYMKYQVDLSKNPVPVDLIGYSPSGKERGRIRMVLIFLNKDKIKIRTFFNQMRPRGFAGETYTDTIILYRVIKKKGPQREPFFT